MTPRSAWIERQHLRLRFWLFVHWRALQQRFLCRHEYTAWWHGNEVCAHCLKLRRKSPNA